MLGGEALQPRERVIALLLTLPKFFHACRWFYNGWLLLGRNFNRWCLFLRLLTQTLCLANPLWFFFQAFFRFREQALRCALFGGEALQPGERVIAFLFTLLKFFQLFRRLGR